MPNDRAARWILSPQSDALWIIGTPALSLGLLLPLSLTVPTEQLWLGVMGFVAVGHHLPGFLRAYGDRSLFRRFAWRFTLAPPLLFGAALLLAFKNLHALALLTLAWSFWHGLMQHYGLLRIYGAKAGEVSARAARLDWWMTFSWFSASLLFSQNLTGDLLEALYLSGLPLLPASAVLAARSAVAAATLGITVAWVADLVRARRAGRAVSGAKLLLLVTTTGFVVSARVLSRDPLLAIALFEVLHGTQYLAVVWAFNRRRVAQGDDTSFVSKLFFQRSPARLLAYVGVCLGYGALAFAATTALPQSATRQVVLAFFATSGLLHFYFDGFIWKLREHETSRAMQLSAAAAQPTVRRAGWWHPAAIGLPLILFGALEALGGTTPRLERGRSLVEAAPQRAASHAALGAALFSAQRLEEADAELSAALALVPTSAEALSDRGAVRLAQGNLDAALSDLNEAVRVRPMLGTAHARRGDTLSRQHQPAEAVLAYQRALEIGLGDAELHHGLANALAQVGRNEEALTHFKRAAEKAPGAAVVHHNLGLHLDKLGRPGEAVEALREAARLSPTAVSHANLGAELAKAGRIQEGVAELEAALRLDPTYAPARANLAVLSQRAAGGDARPTR
jgi:tetratricopeptide (TPR) repeat protein